MTLTDFVQKNIGKKIDFDGAFGAQCVDLFREYAKDVLEIPEHTGAVEGAKDLLLGYDRMPVEKKYFSKITGSSFVAGDVLVWNGSEKNKYGHVAIFLGNLGDDLIVFEQDGFRQDGAKIALRTKKRLLGGLRRK